MKDVENIVQTIIHIARTVIICLDNRMVWQQKEVINAESAEQPYMEDIIIVGVVQSERGLLKMIIKEVS